MRKLPISHFWTALAGALRRCVAFVWLATRHSTRLALHPPSTTKNGTLTISASLIQKKIYAPVVFADRAMSWFSPLFLLGLRVYVAHVFFKSGLTNIEDFSSTVALFENE